MQHTGKFLRELMYQSRLTTAELAKALDKTPQGVSNVLGRKHCNTSTLLEYGEAMGFDVNLTAKRRKNAKPIVKHEEIGEGGEDE